MADVQQSQVEEARQIEESVQDNFFYWQERRAEALHRLEEAKYDLVVAEEEYIKARDAFNAAEDERKDLEASQRS
jgi:hypothetical protein